MTVGHLSFGHINADIPSVTTRTPPVARRKTTASHQPGSNDKADTKQSEDMRDSLAIRQAAKRGENVVRERREIWRKGFVVGALPQGRVSATGLARVLFLVSHLCLPVCKR